MIHRLLVVIVLALALGACGSAPAASVSTLPTILPTALPTVVPILTAMPSTTLQPTQDVGSQVDTFLKKLSQQGLFSGSVLIARNDTILISKGYSMADRDKQVPNTPQTKFRIASITKQFTAMAILQLQQQGKLNVQDLICNYISDCPAAWKQITIHQLLTHTSGMPDLAENFAPQTTPSQIVAQISSKPLDFKPGEKWSYSNAGYIVLSAIIEQVSGTRYEQFLQDHILTPLKLRDTGLDHGQAILATGYKDNYSKADSFNASASAGAGGLYSTVEDLYRWDQALYTGQLISKDLLDKMFTPYASLPDDPVVGKVGYGYGWFIVKLFNHRDVGHGGVGPGVSANIDRFPDDKVTIIYLGNQENVDSNTVSITLARMVFGAT
jgi:CubicO group peptidase (beta-lactamase class C family)